MIKEEMVEGHLVDDCCLFCGRHFGPAGGHYFRGKRNLHGNIDTLEGGVVIPHTSNCEVQICPECVVAIRQSGIAF